MQSIPHHRAARIFVVEDDEVIATLLRYNLEAAGYVVELAEDGIAALRKLTDVMPELIILDWNIPKLSGIEVLRQLRRVRNTGVPVVMLTARADSVDRGRAMALGADAYISKPFAISEIMAAIGRLLKCDRFDPCAVAAE